MTYSRWTTEEELKSKLTQISYDSEIKKSGIPMMYDNHHLYIKDDEDHTIVIGSIGSGKTQTTMLPKLRLAIKANESFIIHDVKGELYDMLSGELKRQNYNTIVINLDNPSLGNNFNPLTLPYKLYKRGEKDKAIELLENVGYYFCCNESFNINSDPFWTNSANSLFIGLALYLFENAEEEEINISSILQLATSLETLSEEINKMDKTSATYINLSNIVLAPKETKASIVSVFIQNIKLFVSRESLLNLLSSTNFDIENIKKDKTAMFIVSNNKSIARRLIPLIVDECYFAATFTDDKERRLSIILDDFGTLIPIKDFKNMLTLSRGNKINFSIYIKSLLELKNTYGVEETEMLKILFGNIIYLLANDIETLEDISKLCGDKQTEKGIEPLISIEELKLINKFEAVILLHRINPIKTKLLPDYEIDWNFSNEKIPMGEIKNKTFKTFNVK